MNNPISGFFNNFAGAFNYKDRSQYIISSLLGEKEKQAITAQQYTRRKSQITEMAQTQLLQQRPRA